MKLDFKILLFEDSPEVIQTFEDGIKTRLSRLGFNLDLRYIKKVKDLSSLLPQLESEGKPDLIVLDWNMGSGASGDEVARKLRSKFHHTDMIFYSAATPKELRKAIFEKDIDGVYCATRENLIVDTMGLIRSILSKVLDLSHMRGIVMSQVSDFDAKINDCLFDWHELLNDVGKKELVDYIRETIIKSYKDGLDALKSVDSENEFETLMGMRSFSSALRWKVLKGTIKSYSREHPNQCHYDKLHSYFDEVIKPRNDLAHVRELNHKGKAILKCGDTMYDDARLLEVRRGMLDHSDNLDDILALIKKGQLAPASE